MPFGLKKKGNKQSKADLNGSHSLDRIQSEPSGSKKSKKSSKSSNFNPVPTIPNHSQNVQIQYKYGSDVSKTQMDIGGLPINIFGMSELSPRMASSAARPPPEVCLIFHLHGRTGSAFNEEKIARQLWDRIQRDSEQFGREREHLIVTFDARNHGHRTTNQMGQNGWKEGNEKHALWEEKEMLSCPSPEMASTNQIARRSSALPTFTALFLSLYMISFLDLYAMYNGTARDVSFLIDFLPAYLFPHDERLISKWAVSGKSLGGHSSWMVLADDPRVTIGTPLIGMPDYNRLLAYRTRSSFVPNAPPTVPNSLKSLISRIDPSSKPYSSFSRENPFLGKAICVCSGSRDKLVRWEYNEDFLRGLVTGEPNPTTGRMDNLKVFIEENIGHEVTENMVEEAGNWIWNWGVRQGS